MQKKKLKNIPANFFLFEKGPWPHIFADMAWRFTTWQLLTVELLPHCV